MGTSSVNQSSVGQGERFCHLGSHVAVTFTTTDGDPESAHMMAGNDVSLINEQYARNSFRCRTYSSDLCMMALSAPLFGA